MKVLNWTHHYYFGPSLGAIASTVLATEYINTFIEPVKVYVPQWYKELWSLILTSDRINPRELNEDDRFQKMGECCQPYGHPKYGWLESLVKYAGYDDHELVSFKPKQTILCSPDIRQILIYPREHHNNNRTYTLNYWIQICNLLIRRGLKINGILHTNLSHRDEQVSAQWCKSLRENIPFNNIYPSTIDGLFKAISESNTAIGIMTGPSWVCLKSNIRQIVLSSHQDEPSLTTRAESNLKYFDKPVKCIIGTSLDWIDEL